MHSVGGNANLLLHAANFERDVDAQLVVHFQVDIRGDELLESGGAGGELVVSGRQSQYPVGSVRSRSGFLLEIGLYIGDYNACPGNHSLRTVVHHTQNRSGYVRAEHTRAKNYC